MKGLNHAHVDKFFIRLLISFVAIFLVAMLLVVIVSCISYGNGERQYLAQYRKQLETASENVGTQLIVTMRQGTAFFQEQKTILYFKPEKRTPEESSELWQVQDLLAKEEMALDPIILNTFAYFPDDRNLLCSAGLYDKDLYFSQIYRFADYPKDFWNTEFTGIGRYVLPATKETFKGRAYSVIPIVTAFRLSGSLAIHVCTISLSYLEQLILTGDRESSHFFICDEAGRILAKDSLCSMDADELSRYKTLSDTDDGDQYVFHATNEYTGWTIYGLLAKNHVWQLLGNERMNIIWILLSMTIAGIILIVYFSHSLYRPIQEVNSLLPEPTGTDDTHDDVKNIKEGVQSLIFKEGQYRRTEQELRLDMARHSLILMLNGIKPHYLDKAREILREQRQFKGEHFLCAVIMFDFSHDSDPEDEALPTFRAKLCTITKSFLSDTVPSVIIPLEADLCSIIFNFCGIAEVSAALWELQNLETYFHVDQGKYTVRIGIGNPVDTIGDLSRSHHQALAALQSIDDEQSAFSLMLFNRLPPKKKISFSFYDQRGIINNIETGNREQLETFLTDLIARNTQRNVGPDLLAEFYRQILMVGRRVAEDHDIAMNDIPDYLELYRELGGNQDIVSMTHLGRRIGRCFLEIQRLCIPDATRNISSKTVIIRHYLTEHYTDPISLTSLADTLHMNAKYISRLFKTETGENLSMFLAIG